MGAKRCGLLERVAEVGDDRVVGQGRRVGADVGHRNHIGRVLDQDGGVAVVGMVVVGAGGSRMRSGVKARIIRMIFFRFFQRWLQFRHRGCPARDIQSRPRHRPPGASARRLLASFHAADFRDGRQSPLVTETKTNLVAKLGILNGNPSRLDVAVVRMGAKDDDFSGVDGFIASSLFAPTIYILFLG